MELAAPGFWIPTALGGSTWLGSCSAPGGRKSRARDSHLPSAAIVGHGLLALVGLGLWAVHMRADESGTAWATIVLVLLVAIQTATRVPNRVARPIRTELGWRGWTPWSPCEICG